MPDHSVPLIATLASAFGLALIFGLLAVRLKLPALVGYLFAGIIIGPFTPGYVADLHLAAELAEIGVMLLMFGVGLHFSLEDLMEVKHIAIPGAMLQIAAATLMGLGVSMWWGWPFGGALVFGLALSVASTVVLLRALEARGVLESLNGRIAVGWLIVEDLVMVLVLVLLPPMAGLLSGGSADDDLLSTLGLTLLKVVAFIVFMLVAGRRIFPRLLWLVARTGSRELFTLCVVAAAVGIAFGAAKAFGVSFALGAFFAGMVMRESEFSHRAATESLPLQEAFAVLFFVSVGMLFDPRILITQPIQVLTVVVIIVVGKSLAATALVLALRYPLRSALTVSASLAQIGEFSFILATLGISLGLMPPEGQSLIVAGALMSVALNPLVFAAIEPMCSGLVARFEFFRKLDQRIDPSAELPENTERKYLEGQVVLVGYGHVGRRIAETLDARGLPYVVAEQNRELVEGLRERGIVAVTGDATEPGALIQAHIASAALLVIATSDPVNLRQIADIARALNPNIEIIMRTHCKDDAQMIQTDGLGTAFFAEDELAKGMSRHILERMTAKPAAGAVSQGVAAHGGAAH
jgi:monovalent cation:H+ antiporter-2, CPA2 family